MSRKTDFCQLQQHHQAEQIPPPPYPPPHKKEKKTIKNKTHFEVSQELRQHRDKISL